MSSKMPGGAWAISGCVFRAGAAAVSTAAVNEPLMRGLDTGDVEGGLDALGLGHGPYFSAIPSRACFSAGTQTN